MKILLGAILFVLIGAVVLFISADPASTEEKSPTVQLSWGQINTDLDSGSVLLDVRTNEEYSQGRIEKATLLPLASIQEGSVPDQDKLKPLYVYCRSGNRSAQAKVLLVKAGFTNVIDLGGMSDVIALGGKQLN
jgi:phage shock protein E